MLTKLKAKVQSAIAVQAELTYKAGLTPNAVSFIGIVFAFFSALVYAMGRVILPLAAALLLFSGYCDVLDGAIARICNMATPMGGFLDSLLDRYADSAVFIGILLSGLCNFLWVSMALVGSLLVSYTRARAESINIKMESVGIAERAERIIIIFFASIAGHFWAEAFEAGIILLAALTNLTVVQRSLHVYRILKKTEGS
ncbi:MAG: archaetidylinositol phosphate synthase [Candidatus Bathyarchaeia archaeon]